MKVLLAIDGSEHSHAAVEEVASRDWPSNTEIQILTVIHSRWPLLPDPSFIMAAAHMETVQDRQQEAPALLDDAAGRVRASASKPVVTTTMLEGTPHQVIVQAAEDWGADLIVLGSHGYGRAARAVLGSVAAAVFAEASCAVEIVRLGRPLVTTRPVQKAARAETQLASSARAEEGMATR
jgi:nucleotide-binding universal stress UspA family protein